MLTFRQNLAVTKDAVIHYIHKKLPNSSFTNCTIAIILKNPHSTASLSCPLEITWMYEMTLFKPYVLENIELCNRKRLKKLNTVEKNLLSLYKSSETNHWL